MNVSRKVIGALSAMSLVAGLVVALTAGPAAAAHVTCGSVITSNTTLDSDVGPCPGDGLVVTASNITLNLNQKRVFAANGAGDNAGIRLVNTTGVRVINGAVDGFDAGIFIINGSANIVQGVLLRENINDGIVPPPTTPPTPNPCDLGDGIAIQNSSNNRIEGNRLFHNGPFGGISVIENSDGNLIKGNSVENHTVTGVRGCGNNDQDEGIRLEGPGANNNRVEGNAVSQSNLAGIGIHGHVGCPGTPSTAPTPPNTDNFILGNSVKTTVEDGINVLQQGPFGTVVCAAFRLTINGNASTFNEGSGIRVPGTSVDNTINGNIVNSNGGDGIFLGDRVFQNRFTNVGPTLLDLVSPDRAPYTSPTDYRVMSGSGSGDVTSRLRAIDIRFTDNGTINTNPVDTSTSGCEQADYTAAGFQPGDVALIQRGTCTFVAKVNLAIANGASAVVMFNEGQTGRTSSQFGSVGPVGIPVLSASYAVGKELYNLTLAGPVTIHVVTNTTNILTQVARGAENSTLIGNRGQDNAHHDGHDSNPNCDANNWANNLFGTVNQACVAANGGTGTVTPNP